MKFKMQDEMTQPDERNHLISFNDNWFVWREFSLRGSGFDSALIRGLSAPNAASLADEIFRQEKTYKKLRADIFRLLEDFFENGTEPERKLALKVRLKLRKNKIFDSPLLPATIRDSLENLGRFEEEREAKRAEFAKVFQQEWAETGTRLWKTAQNRRLQEAIIWQNRQAFDNFVAPWIAAPPDAPVKPRWRKRRELMFVSYLQRYTTKNDTIGFFGPVAWGKIDGGDKIGICEGENFLADRKVFTEGWAIDALGDSFSSEPEVRLGLKPRRHSFIKLNGDSLIVGDEKPQKLPQKFAKVLELCDGKLDAGEITERILGDASSGVTSEKEVVNILNMLEKREVVAWGMKVPWICDFPRQTTFEQKFSEYIGGIKNETIRTRLAGDFGDYLKALENVENAAGTVGELNDSLTALENLFEDLTGRAARRGAGKTYAGRTVVFEDCRRDMTVTIGKKILDEIAPPLDLLFTGARWLTSRTFQVYSEAFLTVYDEIRRRKPAGEIEFYEFWKQANALFFHETDNLAQKILPEFQEKWQRIFNLSSVEKSVRFASEEIAESVKREFATEFPGWSVAKYNSPDIMIAARDVEQLNAGNLQYVLGELHLGVNTLMNTMFLRLHENPAEILQCFFDDFPNPRFIIVPPKEMVTSRNYPLFDPAKDFYLGFTKDTVDLGRGNYLEISDLTVERRGDELFVKTSDGKNKFSMQVVFADILSGICTNLFKLVEQGEHTPRISLDNLVIRRETWRFGFSDLAFAFETGESESFLAAHLWRRESGLPAEAFVKLSGETKPFYLNFDSPFLLENVCKNIRNLAEHTGGEGSAVFSELLPDFDNLWLANKKGEHFTSEFRFVFVDKKGLNL